MEEGYFQKVYNIVERIPEGKVITYGQIARLLGNPRSARVVGWAMRSCPETHPWHRVIREDGMLAARDAFMLQKAMLKAEKIPFVDEEHVDLKKCRWNGDFSAD